MANVGAQIVNPLDPNSIAQQQQLNRRQAYVDMLRQQSFEPVPQDPKGKFSTWAGLAQALRPLMASYAQGKNDNRQLELNRGSMQANALRFGLGGQPAPAPSAAPPPPAMGAGGAPMSAPPAMGAPNAAPMPPQAAPEPQQAAPAPQGRNAFVPIGMDAETAYNMSLTNPEAYGAALTESNKPTDASKMLVAAGLTEGTPEYAAALQAIVKKQGFIEPTAIREGGYAIANDGSGRTWSAPKTEVGMQNIRDANGQVIGQENVPGAVEAIGASEAARAGGQAAGKANYELVTVANPDGSTSQVPKSAVLSAGGAPLTAAPGVVSAGNVAGTNSANQFNDTVAAGQGAKDLTYTLGRLGEIAATLPATGAGAVTINTWKSGINTALQSAGAKPWFDQNGIANTQEVQKYVSQIAQLQASALGGQRGSTDARLSAAFDSLADANKAPAAIQAIVRYGQGVQQAVLGKSQAAAAWQQTHGANSFPQFSAAWQRAYDPEIYQIMADPATASAKFKALPVARRNELMRKADALHAMGAM